MNSAAPGSVVFDAMSAAGGPARLSDVDAALAGAGAGALPRDNGELLFEEPWQGRALGMGVALLDHTGADWRDRER